MKVCGWSSQCWREMAGMYMCVECGDCTLLEVPVVKFVPSRGRALSNDEMV